MAFPWNRSSAATDITPAVGRRRARGRRLKQEEARSEPARLTRERRHQRVAIGIGVSLLVVVFGIVGFGFWQEFYHPPRVWAGSVRNVEFTMGDLVKRIRVLQGLSGRVDLSVVPFEYLRNLLDAEVLRQAAPGLGITITDDDMDRGLRAIFYPTPAAGQEPDPGQLDEEFEENYGIFLTRTGLTDADYRVILEEQLLLRQLTGLLGLGIDDPQEQVEVEWIRLEIDGSADPAGVRRRLGDKDSAGEDFAKVAREVGAPGRFADAAGYVGWVPRQAFPGLDQYLFGDQEKERKPLEVDEISPPVFTQDGIYIVHKLSGPKEQELSEQMRGKLNAELVKEWQTNQQLAGSKAGWLRMNFNSKWYAWVADQVQLSAPRTNQGQGPGPGPGPGSR